MGPTTRENGRGRRWAEARIARRALALAFIASVPWSCGGTTVGGASLDGTGGDGDSGRDAATGDPNAGGEGNASAGGSASGGARGTGGYPESWFTCSDTRGCWLWHLGCCRCNAERLEDALAVASEYIDDVHLDMCTGESAPACDAACPAVPPFIIAQCLDGRCAAVDIRDSDLTACRTPDDCRLRMDTSCCPCTGFAPPAVVAVSTLVDFQEAVCGNEPRACPECAGPALPPEYGVACVGGHCQAVPP